jgi:hypothetical protein
VNNRLLISKLALAVSLVLSITSLCTAQRSTTRATQSSDALSFLPASDGVMLVDVRRLLNETLPRVFAADNAKLAQVNAEIDKFKTETGVDPHSLTRVVLGTHYVYPSPNVARLETVAIARGTFDAKAIAAAGRARAQGRYREERYRGATIMIFTINDDMKLLGLWKMKVRDLAVSVLDPRILAIGNVATVRAAIDSGRTGKAANNALIALASRDPNAVIGFGANVTRELTASLNVGTDTMAADINSIRQLYGAIGSTQTDVSLVLTARTDSPEAAKNLSDTVTGLKQLGTIFIMQMAAPRKALAQGALDNLKITTRANELEIRTQFAAASLAAIVK